MTNLVKSNLYYLMLVINISPSSWNDLGGVLEKIGIGKKDKNNMETSIAINAIN